MQYDAIPIKFCLNVSNKILAAGDIVGAEGYFVLIVEGMEFVGKFSIIDGLSYTTLQSPSGDIYHGKRYLDIIALITWIATEVHHSQIFGG